MIYGLFILGFLLVIGCTPTLQKQKELSIEEYMNIFYDEILMDIEEILESTIGVNDALATGFISLSEYKQRVATLRDNTNKVLTRLREINPPQQCATGHTIFQDSVDKIYLSLDEKYQYTTDYRESHLEKSIEYTKQASTGMENAITEMVINCEFST